MNGVLVSGGSTGIGFEVARALAERGDQIILVARVKTKAPMSRFAPETMMRCDIRDE